MKPIRIAALVAVGAAVVALAGVGRPDLAGGASEPPGGITVSGTGSVQAVPDQAQFVVQIVFTTSSKTVGLCNIRPAPVAAQARSASSATSA